MNQLYDEVVAARAQLDPGSAPVFCREGEYWTIGFQGIVIRLKDTKGLQYLCTLLTAPRRQMHVLDLAGTDSPPRRARDNVSKSLRACLKRIEQVHPELGAHLAATVHTGYFCSYQPDPGARIEWQTRRRRRAAPHARTASSARCQGSRRAFARRWGAGGVRIRLGRTGRARLLGEVGQCCGQKQSWQQVLG